MKNGTCPKCSQSTVHSSKRGISYAARGSFYVNNLKSMLIVPTNEYTDYVCTNCGYYETYLNDAEKLKQIASEWSKV